MAGRLTTIPLRGLELDKILTLFVLVGYPILIDTISMEWSKVAGKIRFFFVLVGYSIHIDTISMELSEVASQNFYNMLNVIMSLKIAFISANSGNLIKCRLMRHFIRVLTICQSIC